jgi:tetratricopeptide (TPR) repeat protein
VTETPRSPRAPRLATPGGLAGSLAGSLAAALLGLALAVTPACAVQADAQPSTRAEALAALRAGRYDAAIGALERLAGRADAAPAERAADRRLLLRALVEVGRYDDAERLGRQWVAEQGAAVANAAGEAFAARGKMREAEPLFRQAATGGAPDSLRARLNLAELRFARGEQAAALDDFDGFIDAYRTGRLTSEELAAVAAAVRHLGRRDAQLYKDALRAYDEAIAADSGNLEARVRLGELFLEKYQSPDAAAMLAGVLRENPRHPRALVAAARRAYTDGEGDAARLARQAIETNAAYAPAHAFLARLALDVEDYAAAVAAAERALATDPGDLEALGVLAAAQHLRGDAAAFEAARARAAASTPAHGEFYVTLAEVSARNRLYADAVRFARQAATLDSAGRGLALLGVNLLRTGDVAAARAALQAGFARDPYDVWTKNTLDLLDATRDYREVASPNFRFVFAPGEADLLAPYATELAEQAYARFAARYGWRPAGPIRLELYPSHADFSVRTVGLAGLGALGVSFGPVLAMDSPAAREAGSFNWGSTLWHEVAHTFTLGASDHRVPRWLSEGISVYEERAARPGWGADATPAWLAAYKAGRVPPPSRMNDGFMRPEYPAQVIFSYYQASLVAELVEREKGAQALPRMLRLYGQGRSTGDVFREVLGETPEQFDRRFDAYVKQRFASQLDAVAGAVPAESARGGRGARDSSGTRPVISDDPAGPSRGPFAEALARGAAALREGREAEAVEQLERAKTLFPGAAGPDSPHLLLATLHERRGDLRKAADELAALTAVDEDQYEANVKLAALLEQLGDSAGAAAALGRAVWVSPYDVALHQRLAAHLARTGDRAGAVRERRAVVALRPTDEAEARYQLALALQQAGEAAEARREVLRALELAPAFERAQQLLLTLRAGGTP